MKVLLVDIDSLRPDHLGCYGYERKISPNIDALASSSTVFTNCFASDTPCLPSRTAMAMGRFGVKNGVNTHWGSGQQLRHIANGHSYLDGCIPTFALLGETIRTASVSSFANRHKAPWFSAAFRETFNPPNFRNGMENAEDITSVALNWLEQYGKEGNWLLHVNYWDVHHPYPVSPQDAEAAAGTGPAPLWPTDEVIQRHREMTGIRTAGQWSEPELDEYRTRREETDSRFGAYPMPREIPDRKTFEYLINGYDASICIVDRHLQTLVEKLKKLGVYEEAAIIITADHGEAFGEHGIYAEHGLAHPPCQRVPMIVRWPGGTSGQQDGLVYQFDLMATLVEQASKPVPEGWDARSFLPALQGQEFYGRDYLVCTHGIFSFSRSVVTKDWLYIRIIHPGLFEFPPEMLHSRSDDPHFEKNVVNQRPEVKEGMVVRLNDWWYATAGRTGFSDPLLDTLSVGPFLYGKVEPYVQHLKEKGETAKLEKLQRQLTPFGIEILDLLHK